MLGGRELLSKETVWGKHGRAGDIKEEATTNIGMPTAHNDDNGHAILGINGGVKGATNTLRIIIIQQFTCPPLVAPLNTDMDVPCPM